MPVPDLVQRTAEKILTEYCESRSGSCGQVRPGLHFETGDDGITLWGRTGCQHSAGAGHLRPVARFCFSDSLGQWTLHCPDPDHGWRFYLNATPALDLKKLLHHIDDDPLGVFWP